MKIIVETTITTAPGKMLLITALLKEYVSAARLWAAGTTGSVIVLRL
jgi:hypothetical protein